MRHHRWGDNDRYWGPFTYARNSRTDGYRPLCLILGSGDDGDYPGCYLRTSAFGHTLICALPPILRPWRRKVIASTWDQDTITRLGRNWYWNTHERELGFSYCRSGGVGDGGFLNIFLGRQTHDSSTEHRWSCFTPWNNWRHVRHSFYGLDGSHFWTESNETNRLKGEEKWRALRDAEQACPSRTFAFKDFDGEELTAKTRIEERQWELGTGWFKWLSRYKKPIIHRSLDIEFSGETGKRKGSWKGGTIGHSIEMQPGELHESAFRRYCAEHEMTFLGEEVTA